MAPAETFSCETKEFMKPTTFILSGWEQAEAEASALKLQLETVTLSKLAAEERAAHLDGALKECMKQVRTVKEESEQKLHDVVLAKTKHWEKIKADLEAKLAEFEQELIRADGENDALSRSIEERTHLLMKVGEEKAQAEAQIEVLKNNIQSGEKEINSLKYELHVVSKELDIRNEEKNMSARLADVATKQHLEDVKKISKLEAECQRLRGLVRKRLPGPAALAQMKMEVDSWGKDQGENRLWRSPSRSCSFQNLMSPSPDYALKFFQNLQKENEHLTAHLFSMEEENKVLKDALSKCNDELQISKNLCAKTSSKLHSMELHMPGANLHKSQTSSCIDSSFDGASTHKGSNPPSPTSMSEDGVDDTKSCAESWSNSVVSELSHFKKEKGGNRSLTESSSQMDLMDDFLEMERLACLSSEAKGCDGNFDNEKVFNVGETLSTVNKNSLPTLLLPVSLSSSEHLSDNSPLFKLRSRIYSLLSSQSTQSNVVKVLDGIRNILRDIEEEAEPVNVSKSQDDNIVKVADNGTSIKQAKPMVVMDQEVKNAVSNINDFVKSLVGQASGFKRSICNHDAVSQKITLFSSLVDGFQSNGNDLNEIVIALSEILLQSGDAKLTLSRERVNDAESSNVDCVDKVTLLEKKVHHEPSKDSVSGVCSLIPHSSSYPDFLGSPSDAFDDKTAIQICTPEEYKNLKLENRRLEMELTLCNEMIESTNLKFGEMEKNLEELTSKLASCEKSNSLAETQLKCMTESYKTLKSQKVKLEEGSSVLLTKIDTLSADLAEERQSHQHDIAKYTNLEEKMERYEKDSLCVDEDSDTKLKQKKEIAAATEKLAQCQETILLLGQQLQTLRPPPAEQLGSVLNKQQFGEFSDYQAREVQGRHSKKVSGQLDAEYLFSSAPGTGNVSPLNGYNTHKSPSHGAANPYFTSPSSSKRPKHRSRSSSFSNQLPEKQGRVFSRLFSKGKSEK